MRGWTDKVSIHAPRMRGDDEPSGASGVLRRFNPRPSHEGRLEADKLAEETEKFQSTPLA